MVEFNGYISGKAKKYFLNKSRRIARNVMCGALLFLSPLPIAASIVTKVWGWLILVAVLFVSTFLSSFIPIGKKQSLNFTPKKIYTDNEYIICIGDKFEECSLISDVIKVTDYGDFYDLKFAFGKKSEKFVCQKDLLIKGTLEEFEALFEGKIKKHLTKNNKM